MCECVVFSCVFVTFSYGGMAQVWYLIVSFPDLRILPYHVQSFQLSFILITLILYIHVLIFSSLLI